MSPLFSCAGCGLQIERALRHYLQQKGQVYCSTCIDRLDGEAPARRTPSSSAEGAPDSCQRV